MFQTMYENTQWNLQHWNFGGFIFGAIIVLGVAIWAAIQIYEKHHCTSCNSFFTIEIVKGQIKNKRRKFAGFTTSSNPRPGGRNLVRQRRITTEYIHEYCVCTACGYEYERDRTVSYDS